MLNKFGINWVINIVLKKKKILYVITKSVWGGAQRYVFDLATNLPKDGFDVAVAFGGNGILFEKLADAGIRTLQINGLERDISFVSEIRAALNLLKIFFKEKPNIIHLNSTKAGALGAPLAFLFKLATLNFKPKVVFTVHGWGFKEDRPVLFRFAIFLTSLISSLFQDRLIIINHSDFKNAKKFIPQKKLSLIHNGIARIDFLPTKEARNKFPNKNNDIIVGTVAELTKNKGLIHLINAIDKINTEHKISNVKCFIVGDGEDKEKLQNKINSLGLQNKIILTGFVANAASCINGFDIFVLPSVKEGLPYTIMEAMAAGKPVIATNVGGIPDLINHGVNGLISRPKDPADLAKKLQYFIDNGQERLAMGIAAQKTAETRFRLSDMVEKTREIYLRPLA